MCNVSDCVVGVVLGQKMNKKMHVIYNASRTLYEAKIDYATTEKELVVVVFTIEQLRSYSVG